MPDPATTIFHAVASALETPEMRGERDLAELAIHNVLLQRYAQEWGYSSSEIQQLVHGMWTQMAAAEAQNKRLVVHR